MLGTNGWVETPDGWVSGGWNWSDFLVHVSIGSSIAAGNFPPEVPYFAGEPLTYHWFADFHGAITSTVAGVDIIGVYFLTSALFAGVLGAGRLGARRCSSPARRSVATIAAIIACATRRPRLDPARRRRHRRQGRRPRTSSAHWSYDNTWADGWPFFKIASIFSTGFLPHRATTLGLPGLVVGRPARRRVRRPAAGRRPARRDPGRAPRAVPVLRLPGDLSHRRPVRRDDGRVAPADGPPRRGPVPRPGRPRAPFIVGRDRPAERHRVVQVRPGLGDGAPRRRARRRRLLLPDEPGHPVRPRGHRRVHRPRDALPLVPRGLGAGAVHRPERRRGQRGRRST